MRWNWGAGSGVVDGRVIGVQVGGRWTDGTGSTENALVVDGRVHKISEELALGVRPGRLAARRGGCTASRRPHLHAVLRRALDQPRRARAAGRPVLRALDRLDERRRRRAGARRRHPRVGGGRAEPLVGGVPQPLVAVRQATDNSSADGAAAQIWSCAGSANQTWTRTSDGTLRVAGQVPRRVRGGGTADGTRVQLCTCNGTAAQRWTWTARGRDLVNPNANKCLDVIGNTSADGTKPQIWICTGGANQKWNVPA